VPFEQFWKLGGAEASGWGCFEAFVDVWKWKQVPLEFLEFWVKIMR
jgi:hypothetical protein